MDVQVQDIFVTHNSTGVNIALDKMEKPKIEHLEAGDASSPMESSDLQHIDSLSVEHRQYLLSRHGTLDLSPVPSMSDTDPFNWPAWKVSKSLMSTSCLLRPKLKFHAENFMPTRKS